MVKKVLKVVLVIVLMAVLFSSSVLAVTGKVTGSIVRIREKASSNSQEISVATKGETVDVIGEEGDWYKVTFEKVTGYMSKEFVDTEYSSGTTTTAEPETPVTEPVTEPANEVVETPSEEPVETPAQETPVETVETVATPVQTQTYTENQTVTFAQDTNLRYLPSFTSRVQSAVASGSTYTVKASLNNWVKVENETSSGWVLKNAIEGSVEPATTEDNTNSQDTTSSDTTTTEPAATAKGRVNVDSARIRKSPNGEVLDSLKQGTEVTILGEEGDWYQIRTADYDSCYIAKRLITEI